jgi:hypothetical protein
MQVVEDDGHELDAGYSIEAELANELLSLVMESSSGGRTSIDRVPRNVDYRRALEVLLMRLKELEAVLIDGIVASRVTSRLPESERRLFAKPITLKDVEDITGLRRRLCTAQSSIGQVPGAMKGGNGTKRIRLRLSVPGYNPTPEDAARLATDLAHATVAGPPEGAAFTAPSKALNYWWEHDLAERFWMEITNRPDVGSNLIAPRLNSSGAEYWSYSLVTAVRPGDIVLHWHKDLNATPGIVGYSVAAEGPFDDRLVWDARGTYGRQRLPDTAPRPAWRHELTGYTPLVSSIGQDALRPLEAQIRHIKDELEARISGPLYFPFVFSNNRPMRTSQAYLAKIPAVLLDLIQTLIDLDPDVSASNSRKIRASRAGLRTRHGAGYIADPVLRKAIEKHAVNCAMDYYPGYNITDVGAIESYDLRATKDNEEIHIEVKGSTGTADTVELTTNEVAHAGRATRTDLVVIDQIIWVRLHDGTIHTSAGRRRRWTAWQPGENDLHPTRYRYRLHDCDQPAESNGPS